MRDEVVRFVKMSGAGNDFLVLGPDAAAGLAEDVAGWVRRVCVRGLSVGADGVLLNTGIAGAAEPVRMARAMRHAIEAGYLARGAGRIPRKLYATASSPIEGVIGAGGAVGAVGAIGAEKA